jgi:hypothetical protein
VGIEVNSSAVGSIVNGIIIVEAMAGLESMAFFNGCLRADDPLNMGDKMGAFSYVVVSNLMASAQIRSHGQLSLKCRFDA